MNTVATPERGEPALSRPSQGRYRSNTPTKLMLRSGATVKITKVFYGYGRNFFRVGFEQDGRPKGCIAEIFSDCFEERDWDDMRRVAYENTGLKFDG